MCELLLLIHVELPQFIKMTAMLALSERRKKVYVFGSAKAIIFTALNTLLKCVFVFHMLEDVNVNRTCEHGCFIMQTGQMAIMLCIPLISTLI